jgi:hypothetical protein
MILINFKRLENVKDYFKEESAMHILAFFSSLLKGII